MQTKSHKKSKRHTKTPLRVLCISPIESQNTLCRSTHHSRTTLSPLPPLLQAAVYARTSMSRWLNVYHRSLSIPAGLSMFWRSKNMSVSRSEDERESVHTNVWLVFGVNGFLLGEI
jgi:hypothetical protein